ncbi:hypothetical protein OIO90_005352 [Microbotryomycetes sp. JL221]|nr:hypothetical protein OIO90_005352 [Microbotryomycetes sp. JL221]
MAHVELVFPPAIKSTHDPQTVEGDKDYSMTSPLEADGSNYPAKGYATKENFDKLKPVATLVAGEEFTWKTAGTATHNGGSCQVGISYDMLKTVAIMASYVGGCPLKGEYKFKVPDIPGAEKALFWWSWFNTPFRANIPNPGPQVFFAGEHEGKLPAPGGKIDGCSWDVESDVTVSSDGSSAPAPSKDDKPKGDKPKDTGKTTDTSPTKTGTTHQGTETKKATAVPTDIATGTAAADDSEAEAASETTAGSDANSSLPTSATAEEVIGSVDPTKSGAGAVSTPRTSLADPSIFSTAQIIGGAFVLLALLALGGVVLLGTRHRSRSRTTRRRFASKGPRRRRQSSSGRGYRDDDVDDDDEIERGSARRSRSKKRGSSSLRKPSRRRQRDEEDTNDESGSTESDEKPLRHRQDRSRRESRDKRKSKKERRRPSDSETDDGSSD